MTNSHLPVEQTKRTPIVDILRGWALLGVAIGNYVGYLHIGVTEKFNHSFFSEILVFINRFFLAGKSWTLLTVLFGFGFAVLIDNIAAKGKNPIAFFSWRMLLLLVLAFIHSCFWFGDILRDYAVLGLLMLFFYKSSIKTLAILCSTIFLLIPFIVPYVSSLSIERIEILNNPKYLKLFMSGNWLDFFEFNLLATFYDQIIIPGFKISAHLVMLGCMFLGVLLYKINFFNRLTELKKLLKNICLATFVIAIALSVCLYFATESKAAFLDFFLPAYWLILSMMVFISTGICLLFINNKLKTAFNYFSYGGKMTLTNYITQNILGALIFSGIGLGIANTMPYWFYFSLALFVFILQLFISKWWLSKFNYGPIEWLWRSASYRKIFPFKKNASSSAITEIKIV